MDPVLVLPAAFLTFLAVVLAAVIFFTPKKKEEPKKSHVVASSPVESYTPFKLSEPLEIPALVNHPIFGTTVGEAVAEAKPEPVVEAAPAPEPVKVSSSPVLTLAGTLKRL